MFFKISVLKNFENFIGTHLCWSQFLNKVSGLKACNFIKKRLRRRRFTENLRNFQQQLFFTQNTSGGGDKLPPDKPQLKTY